MTSRQVCAACGREYAETDPRLQCECGGLLELRHDRPSQTGAELRALFDARMGNVDDPKDAELIRAASPLFRADKIVRPLLIGQGANDPRVKQAESEQIVAAIERNGGKVTYVLYPDEGHGFARPENRLDFNARAEAFLARHLGGRAEPLPGDRQPGSTAVVREVGR